MAATVTRNYVPDQSKMPPNMGMSGIRFTGTPEEIEAFETSLRDGHLLSLAMTREASEQMRRAGLDVREVEPVPYVGLDRGFRSDGESPAGFVVDVGQGPGLEE